MDPSSWLSFILYFVLILGAFYFASTETAFASANRIRIRSLAEDGDKRARKALAILDNFEDALIATLIGNNIVCIGASAVATVFAAKVFAVLRANGTDISESLAGAIATAVTTLIIFVIGEMIPKSYASENAEKVALRHASSLTALMIILRPLIFVFGGLRRLMTYFLPDEEEPTVTEEELSDIIENAEEDGGIDEDQSDLLQSALEYTHTPVADVLTLRDDMVTVMVDDTPDAVAGIILNNKFSRFPVVDGDKDCIVGVLTARSFLRDRIAGKQTPVSELMNPPFLVPLDAGIDDLLDEMSRTKNYLAIVQDKSGKTMGLVTIEDFVEELVGEIFDENDVINENFRKLGGNRFAVSGRLPLSEMFRLMGYKPQTAVNTNETVQTWVLGKFGHVPEAEESFEWEDLSIFVEDVEENRISYLTVKLNTPELDVLPAAEEDTERELMEANPEAMEEADAAEESPVLVGLSDDEEEAAV